MCKAVVFDLFETLITEWGHEKYTKRKLSEDLGVPYEAFRDIWDSLHENQYRGGISFADSVRYVCTQCGCPVDESVLSAVTAKRKTTKAACFAWLHPEIIPTLAALRDRGLKLGILSNCSEEEVSAIKESSLSAMMDQIILSYETGFCKPEQEIYRLTAERLGVCCEDCIFVGDGGSRELYGASQVGMTPYRAMWYLRQMPHEIKPMTEISMLETPKALLEKLL